MHVIEKGRRHLRRTLCVVANELHELNSRAPCSFPVLLEASNPIVEFRHMPIGGQCRGVYFGRFPALRISV